MCSQERRAEALAEAAGDSTAPAGPPPGDDIRVSLLKYRWTAPPRESVVQTIDTAILPYREGSRYTNFPGTGWQHDLLDCSLLQDVSPNAAGSIMNSAAYAG